mgnify:FL=1
MVEGESFNPTLAALHSREPELTSPRSLPDSTASSDPTPPSRSSPSAVRSSSRTPPTSRARSCSPSSRRRPQRERSATPTERESLFARFFAGLSARWTGLEGGRGLRWARVGARWTGRGQDRPKPGAGKVGECGSGDKSRARSGRTFDSFELVYELLEILSTASQEG